MAEVGLSYYEWMQQNADPRVESWLLAQTPIPIAIIFVLYLLVIWWGPKIMESRQPFALKRVLVVYNTSLVFLSIYMFYEFFMSSLLAGYSLKCQPVDYSYNPLAIRMASVCWWFYISKVIELLDTVFFIMRKKNNQITFLHVYHHCTMIINWYLGVKYVAGGQSWFLAMINSFVHITMYTYYAMAAMGPHMQKYLWWKRYITSIQLTQFFIIIFHTGYNMMTECEFPQGFNYAVFLYAITLILLFGNFYFHSYVKSKKSKAIENGHDNRPDISTYNTLNGKNNSLRNRHALNSEDR